MAGTIEGGRKARETNYKLHGKDFYSKIGAMGGRAGNTGGFAANPELAKIAGAIGGRKSRRGPSRNSEYDLNHAKIVSMHKEGYSYAAISRETGIPYGVLINRMHKEGL